VAAVQPGGFGVQGAKALTYRRKRVASVCCLMSTSRPERPGRQLASVFQLAAWLRHPRNLSRSKLLVGELGSHEHVNATVPGRLLNIQDDITKRHFLVDTKAAFSVFHILLLTYLLALT
jgi:hypothetical protein